MVAKFGNQKSGTTTTELYTMPPNLVTTPILISNHVVSKSLCAACVVVNSFIPSSLVPKFFSYTGWKRVWACMRTTFLGPVNDTRVRKDVPFVKVYHWHYRYHQQLQAQKFRDISTVN